MNILFFEILEHRIQNPGRSRVIMAEQGKTYVCDLCGQEVKVLKSGAGTLVCCDQPMNLKED
jgi:superoxide reductase